MNTRQFETFRATSIYCSGCGAAQPVTEVFREILSGKECYDYHCVVCGQQVGTREIDCLPTDGALE